MSNILRRLCARKPVEFMEKEIGVSEYKRPLSAFDLVMLGVGCIMGAGIFVLTGKAARQNAGPAITLAFLIAGSVCALACLCYAELGSTLPVSGSAYAFSYAALGELLGWIVGWDLMLEYLAGAALVAVGWSVYLDIFLAGLFGKERIFDPRFANAPIIWYEAGDKPGHTAGFYLHKATCQDGTECQTFFNAANPQRDLPIGIIGSLVICTVFYIAVSAVLTGMVHYSEINMAAPVGQALIDVGLPVLAVVVSFGVICGLTSVLLVLLIGQPRIFYAMSMDGLLPKSFSYIDPRSGTPLTATIASGVFCSVLAGLLPVDMLANMNSVGTLTAFFIVSVSCLVLRITEPDLPRKFKIPGGKIGGFVIPALSALISAGLFSQASLASMARVVIWMGLGLLVYIFYGYNHSKLGKVLSGKANYDQPDLHTNEKSKA
ncbi:hypothetical protein BSLG_002981 [Batrachochytrium salamandrivorans]|nr:hypothetical protein BSLG_002981 [Batrachochytrium salamandrivorans]